jgi:hypothetical protein
MYVQEIRRRRRKRKGYSEGWFQTQTRSKHWENDFKVSFMGGSHGGV